MATRACKTGEYIVYDNEKGCFLNDYNDVFTKNEAAQEIQDILENENATDEYNERFTVYEVSVVDYTTKTSKVEVKIS